MRAAEFAQSTASTSISKQHDSLKGTFFLKVPLMLNEMRELTK
jgi:hypothetical protein